MRKALVAAVALMATIGFTGMAAAQTAATFADGDGSVAGGSTSSTNLSADRATTDWAGFYGTLDQTVSLSDGSTFYQWTAEDVSGSAVLAAQGGFSGDTADLSTVSDPSTVNGVPTSGTESASNTYTGSSELAVLGVGATNSTVLDYGSASSFNNYLFTDSTGDAVYAAEAQNSATAFDGSTADYQLLVGTNDTGTATETFSFYAQIE